MDFRLIFFSCVNSPVSIVHVAAYIQRRCTNDTIISVYYGFSLYLLMSDLLGITI